MSHSYISAFYHCVFSTKGREKVITPELQKGLWPYLGGIAREHNMKALAVGGVDDHVHILLSISSTATIAKCMQLIKGGSSKWIHETCSEHSGFAWQKGYGAFSIGVSQIDATKNYIANQKEHHRTRTFQEEFLMFLERHHLEYNPDYIWG